jgi:hypothetical protein
MYKAYSGIGSRETPDNVLEVMTKTAKNLNILGYTLRSGGAPKADTAFENGAGNNKEIFLPWKGFEGNLSPLYNIDPRAFEIAQEFHTHWFKLKQGGKKLHARNVHQVLGLNLDDPVKFVLCWTPGGSGSGGTGQAIRIATALNIPIFDFGKGLEDTLLSFAQHLNTLGD